jgi:hypothetical protein
MPKFASGALALLIGLHVAACDESAPSARKELPDPKQPDLAETLSSVLEGGKETSFTSEPGGKAVTIRRLDPEVVPAGDIDPKMVTIGDVPRLRDGQGGWIDAPRPDLESDFLSYASAVKAVGGQGPQLVMEIARQKPNPEAIKMVLECAAAAGFTDVWVTQEPPAPPRKLPVNPAKPVAPPR